MELRPNLDLDMAAFIQLCRRHGVRTLALYGSTRTENFNDGSDIDFLVEFVDDRPVGLLEIAQFELELSHLLGDREVEIRTPRDLSPLFRDQVREEAQQLYAAA